MATIADLMVGTGVDPSGLKEGLDRSARLLEGFGKNIETKSKGVQMAEQLIAGLEQTFQQSQAEMRAALERGALRPAVFEALAKQDAEAFNKGLKAGMKELSGLGLLATDVRATLAGAIKGPTIDAGPVVSQGQKIADALITRLTRTFEQRSAEARAALFRGLINEPEYQRRGQEAANAFNAGILKGIDGLSSRKRLSQSTHQQLVDELKDAGRAGGAAYVEALQERLQRLETIGGQIRRVGTDLSIGLTAPLVAIAAAAVKAEEAMDRSLDRIRVGTGAVGPELAGLEATFRRLAGNLPNSLGDISLAITTLRSRTGASGEGLDHLATQILTLVHLTGSDLKSTIENSATVFTNWGVAVSAQGAALDFLFKVAQRTGSSVERLEASLIQFGPMLREVGFSFEQSAALLAQFEQQGVDTGAMMTRLGPLLVQLSKQGLTGAEGFRALVTAIQRAGSTAEAINLAEKLFGARGAAGFVEAIRSGRLNIEALLTSVRASHETIGRAAQDTDGFAESLAKLRNRAALAAEPLGMALVKQFDALRPVIESALGMLAKLVAAFASLPAPVQVGVIAIAGLAAAIGPTLFLVGGAVQGFAALRTVLLTLSGASKAAAAGMAAANAATAATAAGARAATAATGALAGSAGLAGLGTTLAVGGAVLVGLALVVGAVVLLTRHFREAKAEVDRFKQSVAGASRTRLELDTETIKRNIEALKKSRDDLMAATPQLTSTTSEAQAKTIIDTRKHIQALNREIEIETRKLGVVQEAMQKIGTQAQRSAEETAAFTKKVQDLVDSAGAGHVDLEAKLDPQKAQGVIRDLEARLAKLKALAARPQATGIDTQAAQAAIERLQARIADLKASKIDLASLFGAGQVSEDVQRLAERVGNLTKIAGTMDLRAQLQFPQLQREGMEALTAIEQKLRALGDQTGVNAATLRALREQLKAIATVRIATLEPPRELPTITVPAELAIDFAKVQRDLNTQIAQRKITITPVLQAPDRRDFERMAAQAAEAQKAAQAAQVTGDSTFARRAAQVQAEAQRAVRAAVKDYVAKLAEGGASLAVQRQALLEIADILQRAGLQMEGLTDSLAGQIQGVAGVVSALGDAFRSDVVRGIGQAIDQVGRFKASLGSLKSAGSLTDALAGVTGMISAAAGIVGALGSLFGKSQAELEREQTLSQNTRALTELRASLDRFGRTADSIDRVGQAVVAAQAAVRGMSAFQFNLTDLPTDAVRRALAGFGLDLEQLAKIARQNGLEILDKKGRILAGTLEQLAEAVGLNVRALTEWGQTLADQQRLLTLRNRAAGVEQTPQQTIQDWLNLLAAQAPTLTEKFFAGLGTLTPDMFKVLSGVAERFALDIDTSTAEGRAALRRALLGLVDAIRAHTITLEDLGGLENVGDLEGVISGLLDAMDSLETATRKATESLLSVPQGFKLALRRWEATMPKAPPTLPEGPRIPGPSLPHPTPAWPGVVLMDDGGTRKIAEALLAGVTPLAQREDQRLEQLVRALTDGRLGGDTVIQIGEIRIDAKDRTAAQLFDEIRREAQRLARARSGSTVRAHEVLNQ